MFFTFNYFLKPLILGRSVVFLILCGQVFYKGAKLVFPTTKTISVRLEFGAIFTRYDISVYYHQFGVLCAGSGAQANGFTSTFGYESHGGRLA